ncbi:glyoxylate/hydroxypyruvate reductase A [Rhodobacteraceae bacterium RKSG542]|uniref:2-hydroxyacid dehydrogenase n=1 Tax=Pseudovibrio flavus TaxID=2529854 RepID=UPI0012BB53E0|nr:glyoxylate/hydroxypyruvate reductase A [Pseudovibrio flavus]MTI17181.1 glyoxylate/hydroxypyruvate reductase A [Pseudovibrio flavus]
MSLAIAVKNFDPDAWVERMQKVLPNRSVEAWETAAQSAESVRYLLAWKAPEEALNAFPNVEVIFSLGAGVDHLLGSAKLPDVPIVRIVDKNLTMRMTEWVTLQVLLHHRDQLTYSHQQAQANWKSHSQPAASDIRVGILGLGELGADAAKALAGLGFKVAGWSRSAKHVDGIDSYHGADQLDAFLARTDILVNLLPFTPATEGLVDYAFLSKLAKDGKGGAPVYVNAGRGGTQVEGDLVKALKDGTLKGASIDVFAVEPLDSQSELWALPNCIVTPHVAAESEPDALSRYVADQIAEYEAGRPLKNVVNRSAGY